MVSLCASTVELCAPIMFNNMRGDPEFPQGFTLPDLIERLSDGTWRFIGIFDDDVLIGVIALCGVWLHLDIVPAYQARWNPRQVIRQSLTKLFEMQPRLFTLINKKNIKAIRLARGVGFKAIGQKRGYVFFHMSKEDRTFLANGN